VTLWYLVPEAYSETTMTVTAAVYGEQDVDAANNTVSRVIGKPDLSVTENDICVLEDGYILNLFVENNSLVDARDVVLTVALDEKNADPIYTQAVGTLSRDTYASIHVSIPADQLVVDEQGVAMIYISVESDCADAAMGDNTICVVLYLPEETPCEHTLVETVAGKEPDCTNEGYTAYERCQICGEILEGNETLPALGHDFSAWETVTEATCTDVGKEISRCVCGEENEREIPALGHSYADGVCAHCGKPDADAVLMGDVSGDGKLSYIDALMILRYSLGMEQLKNPSAADINGDGNINYNDALTVLRISIGLE
jgi:hypothetical protein